MACCLSIFMEIIKAGAVRVSLTVGRARCSLGGAGCFTACTAFKQRPGFMLSRTAGSVLRPSITLRTLL